MFNTDKELYHYYGNIDRACEVLEKQQVFLTDPRRFNDPYDCDLPHIDDYPLWAKLKILLIRHQTEINQSNNKLDMLCNILARYFNEDLTQKQNVNINDLASSFFSDQLVFCLSEIPDSVLMWAHYANNYSGICLGFSIDKSNLEGGSDEYCHPVHYVDIMPKIDFSELDGSGVLSQKFFCSKSREWSYEKEWRVSNTKVNAEDTGHRLHIPGRISSIILGLHLIDNLNSCSSVMHRLSRLVTNNIFWCNPDIDKYCPSFCETQHCFNLQYSEPNISPTTGLLVVTTLKGENKYGLRLVKIGDVYLPEKRNNSMNIT